LICFGGLSPAFAQGRKDKLTEIFRFVSMREPDTSAATSPIDINVAASKVQQALADAKKTAVSNAPAAGADTDPRFAASFGR
jgi:hypothetical protein